MNSTPSYPPFINPHYPMLYMDEHLPPPSPRKGFEFRGYCCSTRVEPMLFNDGFWRNVTIRTIAYTRVPTSQPRSPKTGIDRSAEKAARAAAPIIDEDEDGDYGRCPDAPINLGEVLNSALSEEERALLDGPAAPLASDEAPSHETALQNYRKKYRNSNPYPYRNGYQPASPDEPNFNLWKDGALHRPPVEITDFLPKLVHYKAVHEGKREKCPSYLVPCSVTSSRRTPRNDFYKLTNGIVEFTLSPAGQPLHFFLRPLDKRKDSYLEQHLGENFDRHVRVQYNENFPRFSPRQMKKKISKKEIKAADHRNYKIFTSQYGLKIKTIKKDKEG